MKKIFAVLLTLTLLCASFAACGNTTSAPPAASTPAAASTASVASTPAADAGSYTVGLIQLTEHPSLDEIAAAIQAQLSAQATERGITIDVDLQNAQGDTSTINTICQQFVASDVDLIIAIATPAAQGAAAAIDGTDIPLIFSAVTDPVAAELVDSIEAPGGNITGTSDAIPVEKIFALAAELTPDVKSFGLLYNTSEVNSVSVIEETKAYLDAQGISYTEGAVTTTADVQISAANLFASCDAVFSPIDNTVASAMAVVADEAIKAGKPMYVAADSMVADGGLATVGVNYTNLGTQTADMALKVLDGTSPADIPVEVLKDNSVVVNTETAEAINVDVSKYAA